MKRPDLHPLADEEIGEALAYYSSCAPKKIVDDLDAKIESALEEIARYPRRHPYWKHTEVRRLVISRFPYVMFYLERPDIIRLFAFAHTSRRPGYWKSRIAVA